MISKAAKSGLVWGTVLILLGVLALLDLYVEVGPWAWIGVLVIGALVATAVYLTDRSDWGMLIAAYVLWAVALLVLFVTLEILQDEAVAFYVLMAIALPFAIVYLRDRRQWWFLIPAYVLAAVALMVLLIGWGILNDALVVTYVMLAIALPFYVVYARDRRQWWFLIPAGILTIIGLAFLFTEAAGAAFGAIVVIGFGVWLLLRGLRRGVSAGAATVAESEELEPGAGEGDEPPVE
jgi:hypothetical protein